MDSQVILNAAFGLTAFLGGWVFKMIWSKINNVEQDVEEIWDEHADDIKEIRKEMAALALSLPEKYVAKQDLVKLEDFINERFNKLEAKLDKISNN